MSDELPSPNWYSGGKLRYSNQLWSWIVKYCGGKSGKIQVGAPPPGVSAYRITPDAPVAPAFVLVLLQAATKALARPIAVKVAAARLRRVRALFAGAVVEAAR